MYEAHFNLKHKPFSLLPDPEFLFLSSKHAIALSLLDYCLSGQAGFCVITGEIGSGKTTLIRAFLGRIGREFSVGVISNTHSALRDVAAWTMNAFGQKFSGTNPAETYQELMAYLIAEYGAGRQCILIVDEAQNLSIEALEELRLLSNINTGKDLLLQMVLVGQPELLDKLKKPELVQFAQRIAVSHHLTPLPFIDTRRYIEHRLKVAGCERPLFTEMALGAIQHFSGGVPRLINSICDMTLVYAFADGAATIDEHLVIRVVADRQRSGIAPFAMVADEPSVRAAINALTNSATTVPANPIAGNYDGAHQEAGPVVVRGDAQVVPSPATDAIGPGEPGFVPAGTPQAALSPAPADFAGRREPTFAPAGAPQAAQTPPSVEIARAREAAFGSARESEAPGPKDSRNSELYFDNNEEDLLLTLQADDEAAPALKRPLPEPVSSGGRSPVVEGLSASVHSHAVKRPETVRPSWQNPAASLESRPWPSVADSTPWVAETVSELSPNHTPKVAISDQATGTATLSRRSWWRRSLSRVR